MTRWAIGQLKMIVIGPFEVEGGGVWLDVWSTMKDHWGD
jgi:hypothetical protein